MNVKNSSCINKLAVKTLNKSSKRNIIAVIAIALTTLLITSIISVAFSFTTASNELKFRMAGSSCTGYIDKLTDAQIGQLSNTSRVKAVGLEYRVGSYSGHPFNSKPVEISYMDENSAKWHYITLAEGHMPKAENEVVVDRVVLSELGISAELGNEVKLPVVKYGSVSNDPEYVSFVLAGIYEGNSIGPKHYVCCSKDYAEKEGCVIRTNVSTRANVFSILPKGVSETQAGSYLSQGESRTDIESILLILVFLLVIGLSGYLIIYNIFQISVVNDISYYGLLKTIGVTGRQLKKIIRIQSLVLSAIGIPLGIILGVFFGSLTAPVVLKSTILAPVADSFSLSPWIIVLSGAFALVTVFISCSKPGRIVAKISPIEAFRYNEVTVDNKNNKSVSGLVGMAVRNMSRNKKKTVLVLLSMALPTVILSLGLGFANSMSFDKYYSSDYAFKVSNNDYFNYVIPESVTGYVNDFISDHDIESIQSEINFEKCGSVYTTVGVPMVGEDKLAVVVGYDDSLFDTIEVVEGDISPIFDLSSNNVAVSIADTDAGDVKIGDVIKVTYRTVTAYDTRTNETIADDAAIERTPNEYINFELADNTVEYKVCALVDASSDLYIGYMISDSYSMILPAKKLASDANGRVYRYLEVFDTGDNEKIDKAEEYISKYCKNNGLAYKSDSTERKDFQSFENAIRSVVISLCIVLTIIGVLNYINAVLTGIISRSHEFAVLKAIGMTDKQQIRVLSTEGLFYTVVSILIGTGCYGVLHFALKAYLSSLEFVDLHFSLLPMSIVAVVFVLFGLLIPYMVYSFVSRSTVVERLRVNE